MWFCLELYSCKHELVQLCSCKLQYIIYPYPASCCGSILATILSHGLWNTFPSKFTCFYYGFYVFLCFLFCLLLAFLWGRFFLGLSAAPSCLLADVSKRSLAVLRICSTWRTLVSVTFRNHSHFRVRHNKSTNHLPPYPFPFSTHFMVINKALPIYSNTKSSAGPSQFWNNLQVDTKA